MKPSRFVLSFLLISSWAFNAVAEPSEDYLRYRLIDTRLGVGGTTSPGQFLVLLNGEIHLDRFLSFGPTIQLSPKTDRNNYMFTFGGRYTAPIHDLKRLQVSLHAGAGVIARNISGFNFYNFDFVTGLDVDYFIWKALTVGVGGLCNITSASSERFIGGLYASAGYHF